MAGGQPDQKNINLAEGAKGEMVSDKEIFSWSASGLEKEHRSARWYIAAACIILAAIAYSVWQQDWFVIGIIVVVSAILFWYVFSVHPQEVSYRITPMGIYVDDRLYPFSEIHSFWMVYNNNVKTMYFALVKKYLPTIVVSLENVDPLLVKGFLLKKIPEQESRGEGLVDKFTRVLGL
jgi:hypothetical protein